MATETWTLWLHNTAPVLSQFSWAGATDHLIALRISTLDKAIRVVLRLAILVQTANRILRLPSTTTMLGWELLLPLEMVMAASNRQSSIPRVAIYLRSTSHSRVAFKSST